MKKYQYLFAAALTSVALGSCTDDNQALTGEGHVRLNASINTDIKYAGARSTSDELAAELGESFMLWISNSKGLVRRYDGLSSLPSEALPLLSGQYVAEAWAGDSVSASWTDRWFKARVPFEVTKGAVANIDVQCKIANVVVSVEYAPEVDEVLADYTLEVGHTRGRLTFDDEHKADRAYFMMPSGVTELNWTLTGTKLVDDKTLFSRTNKIADVKPGHEYVFKISCAAPESTTVGGAFLDIEVIDNPLVINTTESISVAPIIKGSPVNDDVINCQPEELADLYYNAYITSTEQLTAVEVTCQQFEQVFGEAGADSFEAFGISTADKALLEAAGVFVTYQTDGESSAMKVAFKNKFLKTYFATEGDYSIGFKATDNLGKTSTRTVKFHISTDPVSDIAPAVDDLGFTTSQAIIAGEVLTPDKVNGPIAVYYAPQSRADWQHVDAEVSTADGKTMFRAVITGLTPGTPYDYYVSVPVSDSAEPYVTAQSTFTTEAALQIPNSGFEGWQTSSTPYLIYAAGDDMFWDSGNHGSATMKKNVTVPSTDIKHSGSYSIQMNSQFVGVGMIGRFAAGNAFVGKYLDTQGTDGVLGFGRPFTGRPVKLTGWVRYEPVAITDVDKSAPAEYAKGDMDKGIIYMALLDDQTETYNGQDFPVIVKTKEQKLFDKNGSNVIAYGEVVFTGKTAGDGMEQFEVVLDYKRRDVRPSYLLLTMSASKGGDYFSGGNGSTMWVDDLELIYE